MADNTPYLEGIRVLDFTQYLAGPSCTRLLAEMGAEVIKVEMAPYGDPTRAGEPRRNKRSGQFVQQNRGKKSICVDLRTEEGLAIVKELVPTVDIVVENYSAGVMARRAMSYDDLAAINPRLIMASVTGFDQTGPMSHKTAFDFIAQGFSGMMHMTGEPDGPPTMVGYGIVDSSSGFHAFAAIGYALFRRSITGKGMQLDISMVDSMFHMHEMAVHAPSMTNGEWMPERTGRNYRPLSPAGSFKGPTGWIVILCTEGQIQYLWDAIGRSELSKDPRFSNNQRRIDNRAELTEMVETWMASFPDDDAVLAQLDAHRVPCGPVLSPADALDHPYFEARRMVREVEDPLIGKFKIPGFPIKFSDFPDEPDLATPNLGQHNRAVLSELLGYDEARIAKLEAAGVLQSKDR